MAPMVCRLKYREGRPLGLTVYRGPTFFSLSLEIRNQIYKHLLVSSKPLVVYDTSPDDLIFKYNDGRYTKLPPLTTGLLYVNTSISIEAAAIFYRYNVFSFRASEPVYDIETWDALYSFLLSIGATNRAHLRNIEGVVYRPKQIMHGADGTLTTFASDHRWLRKVDARDHYIRIHSPVGPDSTVDFLSPAIEAVFRILGPYGSKLRLTLVMEREYPSGETLFHEEPDAWHNGWCRELPDYVESMKKQFTSRPHDDGGRVEILWRGSALKAKFDVEMAMNLGWELVELKDDLRPSSRWDQILIFTLRRKTVQNIG